MHWHRVAWWPPHRLFRFRARGARGRRWRATARAEVVIERYYNFGGEGIRAAAAARPALAARGELAGRRPPGLDEGPRWTPCCWCARCAATASGCAGEATALVAPLPEIVPAFARAKTETVTWGANVDGVLARAAQRGACGAELGVPEGAVVVASSAAASGPGTACTCSRTRRAACAAAPTSSSCSWAAPTPGPARGYRGRRLGALPYERMPELAGRRRHRRRALRHRAAARSCASASTGRRSRSSSTWPSGLPTVTIPRSRSTRSCATGQEGLHVREADAADLARRLGGSADDAALRARAGRERARARGRALLLGAALRAARGACCGGSRREDRAGQRGLPAARGRRGLVGARAGPGPARRPATTSRVLTTSPGPADLDGLAVRRLVVRGRKRLAVPRAFARALLRRARTAWCTPSTRSPRWAAWPGAQRGTRGGDRARPLAGLLLVDAHQPGRALPAPAAWCP